jgi:hypothetical protein
MKRLTDLTDASLKRRARRELVDLSNRIERGSPPHVLSVCRYALRATLDEIKRRGIKVPLRRESKCE